MTGIPFQKLCERRASHESANEQPAAGSGSSTFLSGESILAVSAMK